MNGNGCFSFLVRGPRSKKWWLDDNDIRTLNRFEVILEGTSKHKGNRTAVLIKLTPSEIGKAAQLLGATLNRRYLCHRAESGGAQTRFDLPQRSSDAEDQRPERSVEVT